MEWRKIGRAGNIKGGKITGGGAGGTGFLFQKLGRLDFYI